MKNKERLLIIIGGGAAGLFLSTLIPSSLLFEKEKTVGKKLLLTGGGACNLTHLAPREELKSHYYEKTEFVAPALSAFPPEKIISYFKSLGLETEVRADGRVFPLSGKAEDVRDVLVANAGEIRAGEKVISVKKEDGLFIVTTDKDVYTSKALALATGGVSYPGTGSDGSGYSLTAHKLIKPSPALSPVKTNLSVKAWEGICLDNVQITLKKKKYEGSVLFTSDGLSGPLVLNLSRELEEEQTISIKFATLGDVKALGGKQSVLSAIHQSTGLPHRFLENLLPIKEKKIAELSKSEIRELKERIENFTLRVSSKPYLKSGMCTRGGLETSEFNRKTMESKLVKNLYAAGEVLDVDGECGGYNLTFAFSSAYLIATRLSQRENSK